MSKLQLLFFLIFTMFTTSLFADSELEIRSVFERQADRYRTKLLAMYPLSVGIEQID